MGLSIIFAEKKSVYKPIAEIFTRTHAPLP